MSVASLDHIWLERWNQNILAAQQGMASIKVEKSWGELNPAELRYIKKDDYDLYLEMLLLKSSLLRANNKLQKSSSLIASTYRKHTALKNTLNFKMQFELGLDHWCHEDIPSALDAFILAEKLAQKTHEKIYSLSNLLWCLEALDMEREQIEIKLERELESLAPRKHKHIRQQYDAYLLRKSFYQHGKLNWNKTNEEIGQSDFFACFVSHLPYMIDRINNIDFYQSIFSNQANLWQGSYRLRTINGFFIPADTSVERIGDGIDRLYLWTWYWMASQKEISIRKLELTLDSILKALDLDELSIENKLLLRNSLFWIRMFSPKSTTRIKDLIRDLQKASGKNYNTLESEFLIQQELWSLVNCGVKSGQKQSSIFEKLLEEDKRTLLLPNLSLVLNKKIHSSDKNKEIIIDLAKNEIQNMPEGTCLQSPLLTRLFFLIYERGIFSLDDIQDNFGENKRQIYNLFNRAKKFYPQIEISLKDGKVISSLDRNLIKIENSYAKSKVTKKLIKKVIQKQSKAESIVSINAIKLIHPVEFNRGQFQKIFNFSKATATRILNDWQDQGIIERKGQGKAVRYLWLK
jgi:hypothetical protein